jgi:hypothetical protein
MLQEPANEPPWARLGCQIMGGDARAHAGFYFERVDPNAKPYYAKNDVPIIVATPRTPAEDFIPGFVLLQNARQIWAIASGLSSAGDATGLYVGSTSAMAMTRVSVPLQAPTLIRASKDESWILVADGSSIHHVNASTMQSDVTLRASGSVVDIAIIGKTMLVAASESRQTTYLREYDVDTLSPITNDMPINAQITAIVPLASAVTSSTSSIAIALVMLNTSDIATLTAALTLGPSFTPIAGKMPDAAALLDARTLALAYQSHYLEIDLASKRTAADLMVPGTNQILSLVLDPMKKTVLAGSRGGSVAVVERVFSGGDTVPFLRPVLASSIPIPEAGSASKLAYDPKTDVFYILAGSTGVIYPLARQ